MIFGKEKEIKTRKSSRWEKVEKCCDCDNDIVVKYNRGRKDWSWKNNWEYWTENKKNKGKYKCDNCLYSFYDKKPIEFSKTISENKKKTFFNYVWAEEIKSDKEIETKK